MCIVICGRILNTLVLYSKLLFATEISAWHMWVMYVPFACVVYA